MKVITTILFFFFVLNAASSFGQTAKDTVVVATQDSTTLTKNPFFTKDTGIIVANGDTTKIIPRHSPGKAAIRSAILPGWGQAYNKRYWEIPLVYAALGITAGIFIYNNMWYRRTRDAYDIRVNGDTTRSVHPRLEPFNANALQNFRNAFRRDRDYSALWFVIFWGLNVVDATVFAHLKEFDVSEDLSLKVNPVFQLNGNAGLSLALGYKAPSNKKHFAFAH